MLNHFDVSASGLTAQRLRMDIISDNIANVNTTRSADGEPYRRKIPVFQEKNKNSFSNILSAKMSSGLEGVNVKAIDRDNSPFKKVYRPEHPDADDDGYLSLPNVNITTEMVDMIEASRAYEANVTALNTSKNMAMKALEIGRG